MKKNSILKSLFMLSFGLLLSFGALAQGAQQGQMSPQERAERQTEQMKKQLDLTDEQVVKLEEINKNSMEAMMHLRNDQSMDRQARMEKMRSLQSEREAAIVAILTDEQKQKFEAMQQNRNDRQGQSSQRQGGRRGNK